MSDEFRVTGEFCVAGNPTKAWSGTTGEDDLVHVPDDVWEQQSHDFGDDLAAAKAFVAGLDPQTTTHVAIEHSDDGGSTWELLVSQDADADWVAAATPGETPPSRRDSIPRGAHVPQDVTIYPSQEDKR